MTEGIVTAILANYYHVQVGGELTPRLCKVRSRLKKHAQRVWVGDRVELSDIEETGDQGAICEIYPRTTLLIRPAIANVEQVLLVLSVRQPEFDVRLASRFLVQIELSGLACLVVLNKCDLLAPEQQQQLIQMLQGWGYPALLVSTQSHAGLNDLKTRLSGKTTVLAGPSGVGKSSLLNALQPGLELRIGEVSERQGHGRHTTRHVELFSLPEDIRLADTPGFSQMTLATTALELAQAFPELRVLSPQCQFRNCSHQEEPGCAVKAANLDRYALYLEFLTEVTAHVSAPLRSAALGKNLATIHRQPSRRSKKQLLAQGTDDT